MESQRNNDHLLFNKYVGKGHFSPHTDGATVESFNRRSFYSVLVYLNRARDEEAISVL